jgi:hypothetical protein
MKRLSGFRFVLAKRSAAYGWVSRPIKDQGFAHAPSGWQPVSPEASEPEIPAS